MWLARSKWREWLLASWACWLDWIMRGLIDEELLLLFFFLFVFNTYRRKLGGTWLDLCFWKTTLASVWRTDCRRAGKKAEKSFRIYCCGPEERLMAAWTRVVALEILKRGWISDRYVIAPEQEMFWFFTFKSCGFRSFWQLGILLYCGKGKNCP